MFGQIDTMRMARDLGAHAANRQRVIATNVAKLRGNSLDGVGAVAASSHTPLALRDPALLNGVETGSNASAAVTAALVRAETSVLTDNGRFPPTLVGRTVLDEDEDADEDADENVEPAEELGGVGNPVAFALLPRISRSDTSRSVSVRP